MGKFTLQGKLQASAGNGAKLAAIMLKVTESFTPEMGCQLYLLSTSVADVDAVWVTEIWDSKEAHTASLSLPVFKSLISEAMPILAGKPTSATILGGFGL